MARKTRLAFEMWRRGWTIPITSKLAGVAQDEIRAAITGYYTPPAEVLDRLAEALKIHPADVLVREVKPKLEPDEQAAFDALHETAAGDGAQP